MKNILVTITIPTFNSEAFLPLCLNAIKEQTYKNIEINIVDGGSTDNTIILSKKMGIKNIYLSRDALLEARYIGAKHAKGKYVLLLDSDQVPEKDMIARAVKLFEEKGYDMLMLEEGVYKPKSFLEKLFQEDRKLIHTVKDISPYTGVMLPRFYRREVILKAMNAIPSKTRKVVGGQDHAIIYLEAWNLSQKVGILPHAVNHIEPNSLRKIWKKFYRWGRTSVAAHSEHYNELLEKKERFRTGLFKKGMVKESIASIVLLLLKGIPYKLGYYHGKLLERFT